MYRPWCVGGGHRATSVVSLQSLPSNLFKTGSLVCCSCCELPGFCACLPSSCRSIGITDDADYVQHYMGGAGDSNSGLHTWVAYDLLESFS